MNAPYTRVRNREERLRDRGANRSSSEAHTGFIFLVKKIVARSNKIQIRIEERDGNLYRLELTRFGGHLST
jgi:hypothetical protein